MRAPIVPRVGAFSVDLGWILACAWLVQGVLRLPPYPTALGIGVWILTIAAFRSAQVFFLSGTFGHRFWGCRLMDSTGDTLSGVPALKAAWGLQHGAYLGRPAAVSTAQAASAVLFIIAGILLNAGLGLQWARREPLIQHGVFWKIQSFNPTVDPFYKRNWITLPFYYAIGTWPKKYDGQPVFFTFPYGKGPPKQFLPRVSAGWDKPDVQFSMEGPITPEDPPAPERLRDCILGTSAESAFSCARIEEQTLGRHVQRMRALLKPKRWTVRWFEVQNMSVPPGEAPRGVYLSAEDGKDAQDRYIVIGPSSAYQALILDRPAGAGGSRAASLAEQIVGSIRMVKDLQAGKAWDAQALSEIRLEDLQQLHDSMSFVARLAEIEATLISQITVDPSNVDAYYHVAGLSLMLLKHAAELRTQRTQLVPGEVLILLDQWTAAVKPMIQSAHRYVLDINPKHPHATRLQQLWIEAQKL